MVSCGLQLQTIQETGTETELPIQSDQDSTEIIPDTNGILQDTIIFTKKDSIFVTDTSDTDIDSVVVEIVADSLIPSDTIITLPTDTVFIDSITSDTTTEESDLDTIITYSADSIYFGLEGRTTVLEKNAQVNYQNMILQAGRITVNWDDNTLIAEPIIDTIYVDTIIVKFDTLDIEDISSGTESDGNKTIDSPPDLITNDVDSISIEPFSTELTESVNVSDNESGADSSIYTKVDSVDILQAVSHEIFQLNKISKVDTFETTTLDETTGAFKKVKIVIDSTHITGIDTIMWIGNPQFRQGSEVINGKRMNYNLKTKKGFVVQGKTEYGDGYYQGQDVKRIDENVLNVGTGYYTTCDADSPHYHFSADKMKLIVKDKVVAKPVVLYFGKVPAGFLPFAVFSTKSGRHSGIIVPYYGESGSAGRFFRNLGYYLAPSDYWDIKASMSYFDKSNILLFDSQANYRVRYILNGNVSGSFTREPSERRWDLAFNHHHTPTPTSSLNMSGSFVSDPTYYNDVSADPVQRMNRTLQSNATFNDKIKFINGSYSVNLNYTENLDTKASTTLLPRFSASMAQKSFIPQKDNQDDTYWYNKIYYNAKTSFTNQFAKDPVYTPIEITQGDSTFSSTDTSFTTTKQSALRNSYGINTSQVIFSYLNINPTISISQDVTDNRRNYFYDSVNDTIRFQKEDGIFSRHTFSFNTSFNTKVYGMFPGGFGNITGFRHVITPSVSFRYQPDFSEEYFGYYQYIENGSGNIQKKDRYFGQPLMGSTPANEVQSVNFNLDNLFQMKRTKASSKKEEEEIQKIDLFTLNFATAYDFAKDSLGWGDLSTRFSANPIKSEPLGPIKAFRFELNTTHSPYTYDAVSGLIDKFYFEDDNWKEGKLLRLTNMYLRATIDFTAPKKKKKTKAGFEFDETEPADTTLTSEEVVNDFDFSNVSETGNRFDQDINFRPASIPWTWSTTFYYNWSRANPFTDPSKTLWLSNNVSLQLTPKWSISYTNRFDLVTGQLVQSSFEFYRDMHCWEGRFSWSPTGIGQGFYLQINVKSPSLQDLKVKKHRGGSGALGF